MASDVILETGKDLNIKSKPLSGFSKWWAKNRTGYLLMLPFLILFSIFICVLGRSIIWIEFYII